MPEKAVVCFTSKFSTKYICWSISISVWMTSLKMLWSDLSIKWPIRIMITITYLCMNWNKIRWIDSITSFQRDGIDLPHRWRFSDCIILVSDWPDIDITIVSGHLIGWFEKWNKILEHVWTGIWSNCCSETRIYNPTCFHICLVDILFWMNDFSHFRSLQVILGHFRPFPSIQDSQAKVNGHWSESGRWWVEVDGSEMWKCPVLP